MGKTCKCPLSYKQGAYLLHIYLIFVLKSRKFAADFTNSKEK